MLLPHIIFHRWWSRLVASELKSPRSTITEVFRTFLSLGVKAPRSYQFCSKGLARLFYKHIKQVYFVNLHAGPTIWLALLDVHKKNQTIFLIVKFLKNHRQIIIVSFQMHRVSKKTVVRINGHYANKTVCRLILIKLMNRRLSDKS